MTNTTNNSTTNTVSQFDLNPIAVALFYGMKDAQVLPEKTEVMTWGEFKNEFIGKEHCVIEIRVMLLVSLPQAIKHWKMMVLKIRA